MLRDQASIWKNCSTPSISVSEFQVRDEQEVRKLESLLQAKVVPDMITSEISSHANVPRMFALLKKTDKTIDDFEILLIRDGLLTF